MPDADGFRADAERLREHLVSVRRELHAAAEVGLELPETQRIVLRELEGLGLEITTGRALTSVTATLRGGHPGPTVLLRSDMDALPVAETTGLDFAATTGAMHACGHDLHMAGLLGVARLLAARRDALPGTVVLMFQPGEEGFAGGRIMLEEGLLDAAGQRPVAAYAVHVDCTTPAGTVVTRSGPIMAGASGLKLRISGAGGHAAFPHLAVDPVPVAAEVILAVQTFAARRLPVTDGAVLSVTELTSDSGAPNVLAAGVDLTVNIRTLSRETLGVVRAELASLLTAIGIAHGCAVDAEWIDSYPVTVNDPEETAFVLGVLDERYGDAVVRLPHPSMASEDFAYVLEEVPGTLVFLGVGPSGGGGPTVAGMHSEHAVFDDGLLGEHAALLAELAWRRLDAAVADGVR